MAQNYMADVAVAIGIPVLSARCQIATGPTSSTHTGVRNNEDTPPSPQEHTQEVNRAAN